MRIAFSHRIAALLLTACSTSLPSNAADWPGFHGLGKAGVVSNATLPAGLLEQKTKWSLDLKSRDVGSVAVQDGRVYLLAMSPQSETIRLIAAELATGKELWSQEYPQLANHLHSRNTLASSTPATDEQFVYIANSDRQHTWLRCLDHDGNLQWSRDFGPAQSQHGFATSPTVVGDTVLLNFSQQNEQVRDGEPGTSRMIAVDRKTGETRWSTPVTSTRVCYGVPAVINNQVIGANTGDGVFALSLDNGKLLWRLPAFKMRCVSSPLIIDDLAIGTSGSGGGGNHLVAVRIPSKPGETPTEVYRVEKYAPYVPTAVIKDGMLFIVDDKGIASCVDAKTGKSKWTKRIGGNFSASPIIVGDQMLLTSLEGEATVLSATGNYQKIGQVDLGASIGATPAFADGNLLIRVGDELRCY